MPKRNFLVCRIKPFAQEDGSNAIDFPFEHDSFKKASRFAFTDFHATGQKFFYEVYSRDNRVVYQVGEKPQPQKIAA